MSHQSWLVLLFVVVVDVVVVVNLFVVVVVYSKERKQMCNRSVRLKSMQFSIHASAAVVEGFRAMQGAEIAQNTQIWQKLLDESYEKAQGNQQQQRQTEGKRSLISTATS
jgi:hypothetical protein